MGESPSIQVNIAPGVFLPVYQPLIPPADFDIDFLYGGRDSGKSRFIASILIVACLSLPYFRCILTRKVANTIKESQWQTIKDIVEEWGLQEYFVFNINPLEIKCINGNRFYCRGLDEPARIKSVSNPSHCWVEEGNQIEATDLVVILTSLRYNGGKTKVWFSFNPECEGNYTDFWLYQEYFSHTNELSFTHTKVIELPDGKKVYYRYRVTHSTYRDNPYCSDQRKALYESYKTSKNNSYWYQTYTLGRWGYRKSGDMFWKCFSEFRHVGAFEDLRSTYHIVVDNNVNPYITNTIWQVDPQTRRIRQVDEILCESPRNTAAKAAREVARWLQQRSYSDIVYIYGDPSANAKSTVDDEGRSFFDKYIGELTTANVRVSNRVGRKAPGVAISAAFINEIYEKNYAGWEILIHERCHKSIEDYQMVKENMDGTMLKKRETNPETKVSFERYGHPSDCKRYFLTTLLAEDFLKYKNRRRKRPVSVPR